MNEIVLAVVQPLVLLAIAPFFSGTTRVLRAKMHTRTGPSVFQDYYDIAKLFKRQDIRPRASGLPFRIMPVLFLACMLIVATGIPLITQFSPLPFMGDFIVIIYVLVIPRFFMALSSIESSGSYPGVGGIRELLISALIEPSIVIALLTVTIVAGSSNVAEMGQAVNSLSFDSPVALVVAGFAFAIACYVELGKLPFDMAEAEQELQEGPLAEYSGPSLAILKLAMTMKQVLILSLFFAVFVPFGSAAALAPMALASGFVVYYLKLAVACVVCALIENTVARVRYKLISRQTWMVLGCSVLSFVFLVMGV